MSESSFSVLTRTVLEADALAAGPGPGARAWAFITAARGGRGGAGAGRGARRGDGGEIEGDNRRDCGGGSLSAAGGAGGVGAGGFDAAPHGLDQVADQDDPVRQAAMLERGGDLGDAPARRRG